MECHLRLCLRESCHQEPEGFIQLIQDIQDIVFRLLDHQPSLRGSMQRGPVRVELALNRLRDSRNWKGASVRDSSLGCLQSWCNDVLLLLESVQPRTIPVSLDTRIILVFTDGSWENSVAGIGAVLFDESSVVRHQTGSGSCLSPRSMEGLGGGSLDLPD